MLLAIINHKFDASDALNNPSPPRQQKQQTKAAEDESNTELPKQVFTPFQPLVSEEEKKQREEEREPSPDPEEVGIKEIASMQSELEALLKKMDRMDPVQEIMNSINQQQAKMNADLATFMEDNPVDSEEDDEDGSSLEAESRGNQEESKQQ